MYIQKGVGEPLHLYGLKGIYINYFLFVIIGVFFLVLLLYLFTAPFVFIIGLPLIILVIALIIIKNIQRKYGHKGRHIIRAQMKTKIIIQRHSPNFYQSMYNSKK